MTEKLSFKCEGYVCEPCTNRQGTPVRELVRMIPRSVVAFGKLIGDEYWCCPICFEPKFTVKGRKPVNGTSQAEVVGEASGVARGRRSAATRGTGPRLVATSGPSSDA
ncbi:hypothetical protein [Bradyrhizobium sp. SZCCHNRI3052]|uniref:hypothetical protein n=1 Tax=Bradyrhizobium sp. SZCCHNRI3052 TaxID=3057295 RepID=UPI002916DDAB|nr:hypothetical protein [Bradyrhizobium sp. SZCCHNRI3052]